MELAYQILLMVSGLDVWTKSACLSFVPFAGILKGRNSPGRNSQGQEFSRIGTLKSDLELLHLPSHSFRFYFDYFSDFFQGSSTLENVYVIAIAESCTNEIDENGCCVFPFTYRGASYQNCSTVDSRIPWCSLTANFSGKWRYCISNHAKGSSHFYFLLFQMLFKKAFMIHYSPEVKIS